MEFKIIVITSFKGRIKTQVASFSFSTMTWWAENYPSYIP